MAEEEVSIEQRQAIALAAARRRRAEQEEAPKTSVQPTGRPWLDRLLGTGEAALSLASSATSGTLGQIGGTLGGLAGAIQTGEIGTQQGVRRMEEAALEGREKLTYRPGSEAGQEQLEAVGKGLEASKLAGIGPTEAMGILGSAGPVRQAISTSPEAELARQGVKAAVRPIVPLPQPEVLALARKAQGLGIPLRPDMLTDNRFVRLIGEAFEKIPLSGSREDARQIAFNRALIKQIGGDNNAIRLTQDVFDRAMTVSGREIGGIANKYDIKISDAEIRALQKHLTETKFMKEDDSRIVTNYIRELADKSNLRQVYDASGELQANYIPGKTFREINSKLSRQIRTTQDGDLRNHLADLHDDLLRIMRNSITDPEDITILDNARRHYAIGSTLVPLVAKTSKGNISPPALMAAVTSTGQNKRFMATGGGEIGDLARIGQLFLKEPASSITAERGLIYGALGGAAGVTGATYLEPTSAAGLYGMANLYNRLGPRITRGIVSLDPLRK